MTPIQLCFSYIGITVIILIIKMNGLSFQKERNPLHSLNNNYESLHKSPVSYTDQRIQEIKRKYVTPNKRSIDLPPPEKAQKENYRPTSFTTTKQNETKQSFYDRNYQYSSLGTGNRLSKEKEKNNHPQISKFNTQTTKINHFSTLQNFCIKPNINNKLRTCQTDHNFFKPINKADAEMAQGIRCKDSYDKLNRREFQDPRIGGIDKINSKIKHILDCIDHCEKEQMGQSTQKGSRIEAQKKVTSSMLGRSIFSNNDIKYQQNGQLEQTKILEKQQFYQESSNQRSPSKAHIADCIPSLSQMRSSHANNQFSQYLSSYKNQLRQGELKRSENQFQKIATRSTSCYNKLRVSNYQVKQEEVKMDLIEHEISKFQQKIAQLQEQKRKLSIRFKPFRYQSSPVKKLNTSHHIDPFTKTKYDIESTQHSQHRIQQAILNRIPVKQVKYTLLQQQAQLQQNPSMQKITSYDNLQLRKKIGERMQQRKKRIEMFHHDLKPDKRHNVTACLIRALCQQVKLDEQLRSSKNWFSQCNNRQKITILQSMLKGKGIEMSLQQIDIEFNTIKQDESDPFFSFRQEKYTIQSVTDNYLRCISHWNEQFLHRFDKQVLLTEQSFADNFFNKNQILIQDLVRLLNTHSGTFYRNRDLYLIYERIKKHLNKRDHQKLSLESLSQIFS